MTQHRARFGSRDLSFSLPHFHVLHVTVSFAFLVCFFLGRNSFFGPSALAFGCTSRVLFGPIPSVHGYTNSLFRLVPPLYDPSALFLVGYCL